MNMSTDLRNAFIKTIPIMCGYLFLGFAFGISLQQAGFEYRVVGDGVDETVDLRDQDTVEGLSQISVGAGLRFHIGQR